MRAFTETSSQLSWRIVASRAVETEPGTPSDCATWGRSIPERSDSVTADTVANSVRETQAEAVAYVVSRGRGASGDINRAASDHISLNGDANTLRESLDAVQRVSSKLLRSFVAKSGLEKHRVVALEANPREALAWRPEAEKPPDSPPLPPPPRAR